MKKIFTVLALSAAVVMSVAAAQAVQRTTTPASSQQIHIDDCAHTTFPQCTGGGM